MNSPLFFSNLISVSFLYYLLHLISFPQRKTLLPSPSSLSPPSPFFPHREKSYSHLFSLSSPFVFTPYSPSAIFLALGTHKLAYTLWKKKVINNNPSNLVLKCLEKGYFILKVTVYKFKTLEKKVC